MKVQGMQLTPATIHRLWGTSTIFLLRVMQGHSHRQSWFFGTRVVWTAALWTWQFDGQTVFRRTPVVWTECFRMQISVSRTIANFVGHFTSCTVKVVPKGALENPCSIPVSVHFWLDNTQIKILGQSFRLSESGFSMMDLAHCHNSHHSLIVILVRTRPFGTTIPWMPVQAFPWISLPNPCSTSSFNNNSSKTWKKIPHSLLNTLMFSAKR